jgi:hypothetical protein
MRDSAKAVRIEVGEGCMEPFVPMQLIEKEQIFLALTPLDLVWY